MLLLLSIFSWNYFSFPHSKPPQGLVDPNIHNKCTEGHRPEILGLDILGFKFAILRYRYIFSSLTLSAVKLPVCNEVCYFRHGGVCIV